MRYLLVLNIFSFVIFSLWSCRFNKLLTHFKDEIENIVTQIEKEEQKRQKVIETVVEPPSRRINFSLFSHPDKEELIMYGGEYFNGQKVYTFLLNL